MSRVLRSQVKGADEVSISKIVDIVLKRWYFVPIFLIVSLLLAKLYLRYSRPVYEAIGTIKIEEDASAINQLGLAEFGSFGNNIASEIQVMQSRRIVRSALDKMDVDVSYYFVGNFLTSEIYHDSPFRVIWPKDSNNVGYGKIFSLKYKGGNKFGLGHRVGEQEIWKDYYFGEEIDVNGFRFQIIKVEGTALRLQEGNEYRWKANNRDGLVARAKRGLKVEQKGFMVSIIRVTSQDYVPGFAADFVNALCQVYRDEDINIKTQAASQALDFIEEQLDTLERKVRKSELKMEEFMKANEIISVDQKGSEGLAKLREFEVQRAELELNRKGLQRLTAQLAIDSDSVLTTFSFAIQTQSDQLLSSLIGSYNQLVLERMEARRKITENSPKYQEFTDRLNELRRAIKKNIGTMVAANDSTINFYDKQILVSKEELRGIPEKNRVLVNLQREYKVNESVFNTLLEKRAESSVAKASIVSAVRIVDAAKVPARPISPNSTKVYAMATGLGLASSMILILVIGLVKNTISYKDEIESMSLAPVIGEVRRASASLNNKYPKLVIIDRPKSALSESIRAIRTNLQFISAEKQSKMISITSTVSGEGKSFITINLAGIISLLDKKVVVLDLDLRKPKLHYSFGVDNSKGLSTYLVGKSTLDEIKIKSEFDNLDIITSGPIPPNPAELLQSLKMELLLMELRKHYDYIIIDTPPIGLVTDGMALLRVSDVVLYVIRSEYSKRSCALIPDQLAEEQKLKNVYIILNSVNSAGGRYGRYGKYGSYGGYGVYGRSGSGYYVDEKESVPWWKFWKKS